MKKNLLTLFILIVALPTVWATNIYYEITQEKSVSQMQNEINAIIETISSGDTITITGSKTDVNAGMFLHIPEGIRVIWSANYQSIPQSPMFILLAFIGDGTFELANGSLITENTTAIYAYNSNPLIVVSGTGKIHTSGNHSSAIRTSGNIEIKDNAQLSVTTGEIITSDKDNVVITISGGSLTATSGNAIVAYGREPTINISGGYLSNDADNTYPVIVTPGQNKLPFASINISGNAIVEAKGMGCGIISNVNLYISGNAQVISNNAGSDIFSASVRALKYVSVSENARVTAREGYAILCYGSVDVIDNAKVEARENAIAIFIRSGESAPSTINVTGKAQVTAENNYAVAHNKHNSTLCINNGAVFAHGKDISDVIDYTSYYLEETNSGVVLAWDKEAGNTNYEMFSTEDIYVFPESATAYWDKIDGKYGISYAHRENTGFIPLDVIVLSINENKPLSNLKVYPNPTIGVIYISSEQADEWTSGQVAEIEVYDIFGRKQKAESRKQKADGVVIDISHLPSGIYFVRVNNETVKVVKQ